MPRTRIAMMKITLQASTVKNFIQNSRVFGLKESWIVIEDDLVNSPQYNSVAPSKNCGI